MAEETQATTQVNDLFATIAATPFGNILIHGIRVDGTDCIPVVSIMDVDAKSNQSKPP
jgi:hypothetical protein